MRKALLVVALSGGCSLATHPIGTRDPAVEIAQANAAAEAARAQAQIKMMEALVAALAGLHAIPTPTPAALCLSSDGVAVVPCKEIR